MRKEYDEKCDLEMNVNFFFFFKNLNQIRVVFYKKVTKFYISWFFEKGSVWVFWNFVKNIT